MLHKLNPPQQAAVRHLDGPLLVLAGAGSGKTRVITQKIVYMIEQAGYDPRHIAAITFTNKAAREMQERVGHLTDPARLKGLTVSTFHSLGLQLVRIEHAALGYKQRFSILDAADAAKIISDQLGTTDKQEIRNAIGAISRLKNDFISPDAAIAQAQDDGELRLARVYRAYQDTLFAYQAVDFDDLIRLPVELFEREPDILTKWQLKLRYLLIDEYQDTNVCQYKLVKQLTGFHGKFTAVGDDDQSIYAWRGANVENLYLLKEDFPSLEVIKLEQNYRSTSRILKAANAVIANNPKLFEKQLWSELGIGDPISVVEMKDEEHEAEMVAMRLLAHKFEHRTNFSDYAILYRGNHQARTIETQLRNHKIPYQIAGGQSFFEHAEIKDVLGYLRLIANAKDDPAFIRAVTTPKRGVGNVTLEKLGGLAAERGTSLFEAVHLPSFETLVQPAQYESLQTFCNFIDRIQGRASREPAGALLKELLAAIEYEAWLYETEEPRPAERRWKNVLELVAWFDKRAEENGDTLNDMTQKIALITLLEGRDEEEVDAVRMSTLHASKGLEYGHVFLVGCEEGILPHQQSIDGGMVEEERRLMYVGITRAQRSLTITYCGKRKRAGEWAIVEPSRFLLELPQDEIRVSGRLAGKRHQQVSREEGKAKLANLLAGLGGKGS
ncbi:UvrD-helicase domain-containing protein [Chitinimonas koreensis]|uniref:UvrD-helicase domain-containing protein n=1 Tax=Chitinimonas koreensis TaxID=356302 RepID=UPI0003F7284F|nr:UvrD-helicase domain-containing protein [Chitinimonas koreensis]QNM97291.1 UvrD-helicase domain-containing protein [Chitinimonas koreensis]